jgi:hypothetical protein
MDSKPQIMMQIDSNQFMLKKDLWFLRILVLVVPYFLTSKSPLWHRINSECHIHPKHHNFYSHTVWGHMEFNKFLLKIFLCIYCLSYQILFNSTSG